MTIPEPRQARADEARVVGRGVLAIAFAKLYFILAGFFVQLGLPRILKWVLLRQGLSEDLATPAAQATYGDYRLVNGTVSQLNNTVVTGTIQTVSRFASAGEESLGTVKRRALGLQLVTGGALALAYALLAGPYAAFQTSGEGEEASRAAASLATAMRISALIVLAYAFYAIFIGVLNGRRRFLAQASFDISYTTIRAGAILLAAAAGWGVLGIFGAFASAALLICLAAALIVGPFSGGTTGGPTLKELARAGGGIFGYTFLLNLLFLADFQLLRPLVGWGAEDFAGDLTRFQAQLSGVYGGMQNIGQVPYQLVIAVTFVVFPLISRATFAQDIEATRAYISNALRYSLLLLVVLIAAIQAAPRGLLAIPHGVEYAVGGNALRVFCLAQLCFAMLVVSNTILIGAGRTRQAAESVGLGITGLALAAVILVPRAAAGAEPESILIHTALAGLLGMVLGLVRALFALRTLFGASLPVKTALRALPLLGLVIAASVLVPESIPVVTGAEIPRLSLGNIAFTLLRGIGGFLFVVVGLWVLGEFTAEDRERLARVFRRKKA